MKRHLQTCPLLLALALAGCQSSVQLAPVYGKASLGQKPLARVMIQLVPDASKGTHGPAGTGETNEYGSFQITTPPHGEGAVPGHYKVTVTSLGGEYVPPSYADPRTTPLRVDIPAGGLKNWDLKLENEK
jgi:hypothetical protein